MEGRAAMTAGSGALALRPGFELDIQRLSAWLNEHVPGFCGPLSVEQFNGGQSNPTFRLTTPAARYVLRRKPGGPLLKGAHAVDREARVLRALAASGVPVPHVHALCTDDGVIGSWFYVMDLVNGRIFWDGGFPDVPPRERTDYQDAMGAKIASLHTLDPTALGLDDFRRSSGHFERQLTR